MSDPKKASPTDFNLTVPANIGYGEVAAGPIAPQATDLLSLGYPSVPTRVRHLTV